MEGDLRELKEGNKIRTEGREQDSDVGGRSPSGCGTKYMKLVTVAGHV
jgi:hypothetical protein